MVFNQFPGTNEKFLIESCSSSLVVKWLWLAWYKYITKCRCLPSKLHIKPITLHLTQAATSTLEAVLAYKNHHSISNHLWSARKTKEFHFLEVNFKLIIFSEPPGLHLWNKITRDTGWHIVSLFYYFRKAGHLFQMKMTVIKKSKTNSLRKQDDCYHFLKNLSHLSRVPLTPKFFCSWLFWWKKYYSHTLVHHQV